MKKGIRLFLIALLLVSVVLAIMYCSGGGGGGSSGGTGGSGGGGTSPTALSGIVTDISGKNMGGVSIAGCGYTASSKTDGTFQMIANPGEDQIVIFSAPGYVPSSRFMKIREGTTSHISVMMMKESDPKPLDAAAGGTVTGIRNAAITAPAGALVDPNGNPVTGTVDVFITPYDPAISEEALAYPGDLRGMTLDGTLIPLKTFGVMDITVRQNGQTLQIQNGKTLSIRVPAPSQGQNPSEVQMWRFDRNTATWIESDQGNGTYDPGTNTYLASIAHLSPQNCDKPLLATCIYGSVQYQDGTPAFGASVTAQAYGAYDTRGIYTYDVIDANGNYCVTVERDSDILLTIKTRDGTVTTRQFKSARTLSKDYPANCSTSSCQQIRTIVVGTADTGQVDTANCGIDASHNPFIWGGCGYVLGEFFGCFNPQGGCTSVNDPGLGGLGGSMPTFKITFSNGAKMESVGDILSPFGGFSIKVYGPGSDYCGEMVPNDTGMEIITKSGDNITIRTTQNGGMEFLCSNGFSTTLTGAQMDALGNCSGHAGDAGSGVGCTPEPGSFTASCNFDSDCNSGFNCCPQSGNNRKCVPSAMCSTICSSSSDCSANIGGNNFVCCSTGFIDACLPFAQCK
jgi:hypothetical protein